MCFSASASFIVGGGLTAVGVASLKTASKKEKLIALIPFLFGIQQIIEGFVWLGLMASQTTKIPSYAFLVFAFLLWPTYIPLTIFLLDKKSRGITRWFLALGVALTLFYSFVLLTQPLNTLMVHRSIKYLVTIPFGQIHILFYLLVTCGALILSSKSAFRIFGVITFLSSLIAAFFFSTTSTSVWCFFAAVLSALIYFYLHSQSLHKQTTLL